MLRRMFLVFVFALVGALAVAACGAPAYTREPEPQIQVTPAVKATCVLLRAFTSSGTLEEVCATAEDLAPFVSVLLAEHAADVDAGASRPIVAFAMPSPRRERSPPRRRCAAWVSVDAGASASVHDAGAEQ